MNPQEEKMLERITDTLGDDVQSHKEFNMLKLAKVLVEMEGRIESIETGQEIKTQRELTPKLLKAVDKLYEEDPYLTALDDVEKRVKPVKEPLLMTKNVLEVIDDLRKKHKE